MKRLLIVLFLLFGFLFSINPSFAENFYIKDYKVKMYVSADRNVDVREEIQVYFTNASHGIIRDIPKKNKDEIYNISATEAVGASCTSNACSIKMGDPHKRITGDKTYYITYNHRIKSKKNEFYYNIIGTGWNTYINKVEFEVNMPLQFDPKKVGLSIGKYGTKGFKDRAYFWVDNTTIKGVTTKPLSPNEAITLRLEVPKGYFSNFADYNLPIACIILISAALSSFFLWFIYGKDDEVIPVVSFAAPANLNPVEAEIVFKEKASLEGLTALMVYLASKGYISIESPNYSFILTKLKDFNDLEPEERDFAEALFEGETKTYETKLKYSKTFYIKCSEIVNKYNKKRGRVFEENSISFGIKALSALCLLICLITTFAILCDFDKSFLNSDAVCFLPFIILGLLILMRRLIGKKNPAVRINDIIFGLVFSVFPIFIFFQTIKFNLNTENIWGILFGLICFVVCAVCFYLLPKRNKIGNKLQGELLGLKQFIEVAEKGRLEAMVKENPSYFYNILPFAYILGVSDVWIKQFEDIMARHPEYSSYYMPYHSFDSFASSFGSCAAPSHENGGISSSSSGGGGFSGGGGGGGGGSSW